MSAQVQTTVEGAGSPGMSLVFQDPTQNAFRGHVSLGSSSVPACLGAWRALARCFSGHPLLESSSFSRNDIVVVNLRQEYQEEDVPCASREHGTCLIPGVVHLSHREEVVSAGFIHSTVTIFPLLINK